ncbi:hypothetical protein FHW17_003727 [Phyllobacterium sp. P30BS-XVII]|nr:hypothetical protein [Phyllobacterium sp. P30BS-XVII]
MFPSNASVLRGSWLNITTLREIPLPVILGLDPRTHANDNKTSAPSSWVLGSSPRMTEIGGCEEAKSAASAISVASPLSLMVVMSNHEPRPLTPNPKPTMSQPTKHVARSGFSTTPGGVIVSPWSSFFLSALSGPGAVSASGASADDHLQDRYQKPIKGVLT